MASIICPKCFQQIEASYESGQITKCPHCDEWVDEFSNEPTTMTQAEYLEEKEGDGEGEPEQSGIINMLWFILGSLGGLVILILEQIVLEPFLYRGTRTGTNPFGGAIYERDQFSIDASVGLGMVVVRWFFGGVILELGAPRWLGYGIIVGTPVFGIMFLF